MSTAAAFLSDFAMLHTAPRNRGSAGERERFVHRCVRTGALCPQEIDILAWWKQHEDMLPQVAALAKQCLAAPAGVVDLERLFSRRARKLSEYSRWRLKFERLLVNIFNAHTSFQDEELQERTAEAQLDNDDDNEAWEHPAI